MTATYQIPESQTSRVRFRSKPVDPRNIHAIIPTCDDWEGLRLTLDSLRRMNPPPKKITVVNDSRFKNPPDWLSSYRVESSPSYEGNMGPAFARNVGFGFHPQQNDNSVLSGLSGSRYVRLERHEWREDSRLEFNTIKPVEFGWRHNIEWFYFTDCGCEHVTSLFAEFEKAWKETGDSCVAISGPIS